MKKILSVIIIAVLLLSSLVPCVLADDDIELPVVDFNQKKQGDVNGDKRVDNKDVVLLFRYLSGGEEEIIVNNADLNRDGQIDNKDVVALFRYVSSM